MESFRHRRSHWAHSIDRLATEFERLGAPNWPAEEFEKLSSVDRGEEQYGMRVEPVDAQTMEGRGVDSTSLDREHGRSSGAIARCTFSSSIVGLPLFFTTVHVRRSLIFVCYPFPHLRAAPPPPFALSACASAHCAQQPRFTQLEPAALSFSEQEVEL